MKKIILTMGLFLGLAGFMNVVSGQVRVSLNVNSRPYPYRYNRYYTDQYNGYYNPGYQVYNTDRRYNGYCRRDDRDDCHWRKHWKKEHGWYGDDYGYRRRHHDDDNDQGYYGGRYRRYDD